RMLSGTSSAASATGSWLFDSGAQLSFISSAMALSLGVELSFDQDGNPVLTDLNTHAAPAGQFEVALGGAGGNAGTLLGFTVDELDLPTTDGLIKFHNVTIAVLDVTVSDGTTSYTLDGDFGMNLLLPSMDTTAGNTTGGAFDFFSFDEATGLLSLTDSTVVPEPAAMGLLVLAGVLSCRRRRRMPRD
ncbi:MAG: PEP-CTERM sorting domain-containing protein, partial [Tepidisphaeraceae bacterium]